MAESTNHRVDDAVAASYAESADLEVNLKLPLMPFQKAGVACIEAHKGRLIIADDVGLGKSAQSIAYLVRHPEALPALIICPASLRVNWLREIAKFCDLKAMIVASKTGVIALERLGVPVHTTPVNGFQVIVTNHDIFRADGVTAWIRKLLSDDPKAQFEAAQELQKAGRQALYQLNKVVKKLHEAMTLEQKTREEQPLFGQSKPPENDAERKLLLVDAVLQKILDMGRQARQTKDEKHIKLWINGIPAEDFLAYGFKSVIMDEAQNFKDRDAQRSEVAVRLGDSMEHCLLLTGTPLMNCTSELWNLTRIVDKTVFPSFFDYACEFSGGWKDNFGWHFDGASNLEKLNRILRERLMIRREKTQVLKELPDKRRVTILLVIDKELDLYDKEASPVLEKLREEKRVRDEWKALLAAMDRKEREKYLAEHAEQAAVMNKMTAVMLDRVTKLRLIAARAKMAYSVERIVAMAEATGKLLVFAHHHQIIDQLVTEISAAGIRTVKIDGRDDAAVRQRAIDAIQQGDAQVGVLGILAAGVGLTLTAASNVVFHELALRPSDIEQAEGRVWRNGQKNAVTSWFFVAAGTIEESIARMLDGKRETVNAAVGETHRTIDEDGILDAILSDNGKFAA